MGQPDADVDPLAQWFQTVPGQQLLERENAAIAVEARRLHGETMLWLGLAPQAASATQRSMVRARFYGALGTNGPAELIDGIGTFRTDVQSLPFPNACVDGLVLHHALDVATDPRLAIAEVNRVLKPGARLVICGFNPWSLWTGARANPGFRRVKPLSLFRLHDWIAVLGLVREKHPRYISYRGIWGLNWDSVTFSRISNWINRLQPPLGGVYVTVAIKQTHAMPTRLVTHTRDRKIDPVTIPRPTARQ